MQGVLTEVLCDGYDELSLIWLSSTVRELSSKSQHQLVLLSYLINWMKSCEQVSLANHVLICSATCLLLLGC